MTRSVRTAKYLVLDKVRVDDDPWLVPGHCGLTAGLLPDGLEGQAVVLLGHAALDLAGLGDGHQGVPDVAAEAAVEGHAEHGLLEETGEEKKRVRNTYEQTREK